MEGLVKTKASPGDAARMKRDIKGAHDVEEHVMTYRYDFRLFPPYEFCK